MCRADGVPIRTKGYVLTTTPTKIIQKNVHRKFLGFATQGNQDVFIALGDSQPAAIDYYRFPKTDRMHFQGGIPISAIWAYGQADGAVLVVAESG